MMESETQKEKVQFCVIWTLLNTAVAAISSMIGIIVFLLIRLAFNIPEEETGPLILNMIGLIVCTAVIGICLGITQRWLLRKVFAVPSVWLYSLVIGSIIAEILFGIIYWKTDIVESFGEDNLLGGAIILTIILLFIGLVQLQLLSRHYSNSGYWILASILPGIIIIPIIAITRGYDLDWSLPSLFGFTMYFACTGITLMWILKAKKVKT